MRLQISTRKMACGWISVLLAPCLCVTFPGKERSTHVLETPVCQYIQILTTKYCTLDYPHSPTLLPHFHTDLPRFRLTHWTTIVFFCTSRYKDQPPLERASAFYREVAVVRARSTNRYSFFRVTEDRVKMEQFEAAAAKIKVVDASKTSNEDKLVRGNGMPSGGVPCRDGCQPVFL